MRWRGRHLATVVVENKTGAAGNIGVAQIAKAAPDGATFGIVPAGNIAVNPALYPDLPYKASELAPVTMLATVENVLVVNAEKGARAHPEGAARVGGRSSRARSATPRRARAARRTWRAPCAELDTGVKLLHVPYRGMRARESADLLGGGSR